MISVSAWSRALFRAFNREKMQRPWERIVSCTDCPRGVDSDSSQMLSSDRKFEKNMAFKVDLLMTSSAIAVVHAVPSSKKHRRSRSTEMPLEVK